MQWTTQPSRSTTTYHVEWLRRDFTPMSPKFRAIRAKARNKMDTCFKCRHKFIDGEMMGLMCIKSKGNRPVCADCADILEKGAKK